MSRIKNSTFDGVRISDVDANAPSFRRAVAEVAGDVALIYDLVTGEHAEANTIDHSEAGRGAPIGMPLVNQWIGRSVHMTTPEDDDSKHGGVGETMLIPYVLFVPPQETQFVFRFDWETDLSIVNEANPHLVVKNTDLDFVCDVPFTAVTDGRTIHMEALATSLTSGLFIVYVAIDTSTIQRTSGDIPLGRLAGVSVFFPGRRGGSASPVIEDTDEFGVTEPAATDGVAVPELDTQLFDDTKLYPVDSMITQATNRGLNGLLEYITGWPAGGNPSYTLEDQDGGGAADASNPARSRFFAHTRSLYASEPEIALPLVAQSLGAQLVTGRFVVDAVEPPTFGMLDWHAPWPKDDTLQRLCSLPTIFPDFQSASSNLKCAVLIGSNGYADVDDWTVYCITAAGSADANPVSLNPGTDTLWLAEIDAVPFTGDAQSVFRIMTERGSAKPDVDEICILAFCLYWEP